MPPSGLGDWFENTLNKVAAYQKDDKVVIVSIVGKSPDRLLPFSKAGDLHSLLDTDVFRTDALGPEPKPSADSGQGRIQAHYDAKLGVIFFHLISFYDLRYLIANPAPTPESGSLANSSIYHFLKDKEEYFAKQCLFLFSISHIVLLYHPNCFFDTSYIRFFRNLDALRVEALGQVCSTLKSTLGSSVAKSWGIYGRPCAPRLLFIFHNPPVRRDPEKRLNPVRKLEGTLEEQIYRILRKSRIVTNNCANSLCAIPSNESFVYIFSEDEKKVNPLSQILDIITKGTPTAELDKDVDSGSEQHLDGFYDFLMQHIDRAFNGGFNDVTGRGVMPAPFELPKIKNFAKIASHLHNLLLGIGTGQFRMSNDSYPRFDTEMEFSEGRCAKVYPYALSTYQEGLPPYYTSVDHKNRLNYVIQLLAVQARGPLLGKYTARLVKECEKYWQDGRQACESLSLRGNHCLNQRHVTAHEDAFDLPVLQHSSKVTYICTCSCGHRQAVREDPFDVRTANYGFYWEAVDFICCKELVSIDFPCFQPSTSDIKAATILLEGLNIMTQSQEADEPMADNDSSKVYSAASADFLPAGSRQYKEAGGDLVESKSEGAEAQPLASADIISKISAHDSQLSPTSNDDLSYYADSDEEPSSAILALRSKEEESPGELSDDPMKAMELPVVKEPNIVDQNSNGKKVLESEDGYDPQNDEDQTILSSPSKSESQEQTMVAMPDENTSQEQAILAPPANNEPQDIDLQQETNKLTDPVDESRSNSSVEREEMIPQVTSQTAVKEEFLSSADVRSTNTADSQEAEDSGGGTPAREHKLDLDTTLRDEGTPERHPSTVEYLPGMMHLGSPPGVLPLFSSWSMLCIGPSSIYSHAHGLREQPNFSHGSAYLLPWEASCKVDLARWVTQMENLATRKPIPPAMQKKRHGRRNEDCTVTVKVFVGFEYECPRGHRFMLQTPQKMLKHSGPGGPKDSASPLIKSDLPLWFPCSCRAPPASLTAQLMRIHVVTPKMPLKICINPRVQPEPPLSPTFTPSGADLLKLNPAEYWILRLPYVYVGDRGPFLAPKANITNAGRFLKNALTIEPFS